MLKKLIPLGVAIVIALSLVMCQEGHHHEPKIPGGTIVGGDTTPFPGPVNPVDRTKLVPTPSQHPAESDGSQNATHNKESLQTAIESCVLGSFDVDLLLDEALGYLSLPLSERIDLDHWDQGVFAFPLKSQEQGLEVHLIIEREKVNREGQLWRSCGLRIERSYENERKYVDGILREDSRLDIQVLFDESGTAKQLLIGAHMPVALGRAKALGVDLYHGQYVDSAIYSLVLDNMSEPFCKITGLQNGQPVQPGLFPGTTLPGQLWPHKDLLEVFSAKLYSLVLIVEEKR